MLKTEIRLYYEVQPSSIFVEEAGIELPGEFILKYRTNSGIDESIHLTTKFYTRFLIEELNVIGEIKISNDDFDKCHSFPEKVLESYNIIEYKKLDEWINNIFFDESDELSKEIIIEGKRGDEIINQLLKFKDVMEYWFNNNTQHKSFFEIQKKILRHPQIAKERFKPSPDFRTINFKNTIYNLTDKPAEVIRILYYEYCRGTAGVSKSYILGEVDGYNSRYAKSRRVQDIFQSNTDAWKNLVKLGKTRGTYVLNI